MMMMMLACVTLYYTTTILLLLGYVCIYCIVVRSTCGIKKLVQSKTYTWKKQKKSYSTTTPTTTSLAVYRIQGHPHGELTF